MPYISNTPESKSGVNRSDSRDANTTCRGVTCSGKQCRRSLPRVAGAKLLGVDTKATANNSIGFDDSFCWQHKDQARTLLAVPHRTASFDTLVERLQTLDLHEPEDINRRSIFKREYNRHNARGGEKAHAIKEQSHPTLLSRLCCTGSAGSYEDRLENVRHRPAKRVSPLETKNYVHGGFAAHLTHLDQYRIPEISRFLPSNVQARLRQELSKPINFDEDGYIYMYRKVEEFVELKPTGICVETGLRSPSSQLDGLKPRPILRHRLTEEPEKPSAQGKLLVKIGCTKNVQSRLSAWSWKCGSKIELLRYYPYTPSNFNAALPKTVPNCHRVERLIHIELSTCRVKRSCNCGSIHREWFEIEASEKAVKAVDTVIRKWVSWAERQPD